MVIQIVRTTTGKAEASNKVKLEARKLCEADQRPFIEVVETDCLVLHEGDFVRYRIKQSEFSAWKKRWGFVKK